MESCAIARPEALVNGSLFGPWEMEDKWAIFVHDGELLVVRGWRRKVWMRARIEEGEELRVHEIRGTITERRSSGLHLARARLPAAHLRAPSAVAGAADLR